VREEATVLKGSKRNLANAVLSCAFAALALCLFTGPVSAIHFSADVLESENKGGHNGLKTFDTEWIVGVNQTVAMDVWVSGSTEPLLTSGFQVLFDTSRLAVEDVTAFDDMDQPGPWDYLMTRKAPNPRGPGYRFACCNLSSAPTDGCGDVLIARLTFRCNAPGESMISFRTIPDFDSVVGDSGKLYDPEMTTPVASLFSMSPFTGMVSTVLRQQPHQDFPSFPVCILKIE